MRKSKVRVTWLLADSHFNHDRMRTHCDRPENFTELIIKRCQEVIQPEDLVIHLGDVAIGNRRKVKDIMAELPGTWVLVRGNHDMMHGNDWWMHNGFAFSCDAMVYRNAWLTHKPSDDLPAGCTVNIHGHLHNWGFKGFFAKPHQLLFAVEYTGYRPVAFDKFVAHPEKFKANIHQKKENTNGREEEPSND